MRRASGTTVTVEARFRPAAVKDLFDLHAFIATQSGTERASAYVSLLEAACLSLGDFPERGTRRDDLRPGLRTLGFRRQASIVFRITADGVEIGRILHGGRDLAALAITVEEDEP